VIYIVSEFVFLAEFGETHARDFDLPPEGVPYR
jgi:hypothetical protein